MANNLHVLNDWMIVLDKALPERLCDDLIAKNKAHLKASGILGNQIHNYRTSWDIFLDGRTALTQTIEELIAKFTSLPLENQEGLSIIKYTVGQEYKEHYDFLHQVPGEIERGGDRLYTAIFYLNDDFLGGQTYFPKIDLAIIPKKARMLIWKNYINGIPNYDSLHAGLPVESGEKWIATKWVREREFK